MHNTLLQNAILYINNMFKVIWIITIFFISKIYAQNPLYYSAVAKCEKNLNSPPAIVSEMHSFLTPQTKSNQPPSTAALCLLTCVKKEIGMMTSDNRINAAYVNQTLQIETNKQNDMLQILKFCEKNVRVEIKPEECRDAYNIVHCIRAKSEEMNISAPVFTLVVG